MTPEERQQLAELKKTVDMLVRGEHIQFIEQMNRRLDIPRLINDLADVDDTGITDGQLLKWDATNTRYLPDNDNTA